MSEQRAVAVTTANALEHQVRALEAQLQEAKKVKEQIQEGAKVLVHDPQVRL